MRKLLRKLRLLGLAKFFYYDLAGFANRIYNATHPTAWILLYHRVAETADDPHQLAVSPANFEEQIKFLRANYNVISLAELVGNLRNKKLHNHSVVITLDDGYADNLTLAYPILEKYRVPAAVFVTVGYIDSGESFFWDASTPSTDRGRPLTAIELRELAGKPLIEIGAHTLTHPRLASLTKEQQWHEIGDGKKLLEDLLGRPANGFAYPFGDAKSFNQDSFDIVHESGYHYALANIHNRVRTNSDIYALPRFIPRNWNLLEFKRQVKNWL